MDFSPPWWRSYVSPHKKVMGESSEACVEERNNKGRGKKNCEGWGEGGMGLSGEKKGNTRVQDGMKEGE